MSESPAAIERTDGPSGGAYHLVVDGHEARMTFSRAGERLLIIEHTEVPEALRGRGIGDRLVARAVDDARQAGIKIFPLCPFAAAQFRKRETYSEVLSR